MEKGKIEQKIILHLCADIGSDSRYYQLDEKYSVILVGKNIGVENYEPPENVHGIIANPVCTEFSNAKNHDIVRDYAKGMFLVNHCMRIIEKAAPKWWVLENPSTGALRKFLGKPKHTYQPWQFGSPWTKNTGLWGNFTMPEKTVKHKGDVTKNPKLYIKPRSVLPEFTALHKSAINHIPEFEFAKKSINCDADFRSLCSQGFAKAFYESNP